MTWLLACKEYAAKNGKWTVPKKGTDEYNAIKQIQGRMTSEKTSVVESITPAKVKKPRKPKAVVEIPEVVVEECIVNPVVVKPRKRKTLEPRAPKSVPVIPEVVHCDPILLEEKKARKAASDACIAAPVTIEHKQGPIKKRKSATVKQCAQRIVTDNVVKFN